MTTSSPPRRLFLISLLAVGLRLPAHAETRLLNSNRLARCQFRRNRAQEIGGVASFSPQSLTVIPGPPHRGALPSDKRNFRYSITPNAGLFDMEIHLRARGLATAPHPFLYEWLDNAEALLSQFSGQPPKAKPIRAELLPFAKYAK
jgi:hypothetical protein